MICVSIHDRTYEEILRILAGPDVEMAEIRLDLCPALDKTQIRDIFENSDTPLVATARGNADLLALAIEAGARYADLEIEAPSAQSRRIQKLCKHSGTELIRSYHNFSLTPDDDFLQKMLARCFRYGADIAKIVCAASSEEDAARIQALYSVVLEGVDSMEGRLIAFSMGEPFRESRVDCLKRGAPFSYAALDGESASADGQMTLEEMTERLYRGRKPFCGENLVMPASKSFAQRAIIAAALAGGKSVLQGYTACEDSEAAISVAQTLGAKVERIPGDDGTQTLSICGISASRESLDISSIDVGESGLLCRLMIPLMSVLGRTQVRIEGRGTLMNRPLCGAVNKMAAFGVMLYSDSKGPKGEIRVPLTIKGHIVPGTADVDGSDGSQLISGLLMALPLCSKLSQVYVGTPKSIPYMYITQDVMRNFGVGISTEMEGNAEMLELQDWSYCTGMNFRIPSTAGYKAASFRLESDWSSAANFLVAGAVFGSVGIRGLDSSSLQADISILDILVDAGAIVSETEDGVVGVRKAPLEAFEADLSNAPDLFPIAAVLASFCAGQSCLSGVGRLSGKESDRAAAIVDFLSKMGVEASVEGDEMLIQGEQLSSRIAGSRLLRGGKYSSRHDHRIAMALTVASLGADSPIEIDDIACTAKSFPDFVNKFKII